MIKLFRALVSNGLSFTVVQFGGGLVRVGTITGAVYGVLWAMEQHGIVSALLTALSGPTP